MDKQVLNNDCGIISQLVMRDSSLHIEAKNIYSYMCANADLDRKISITVIEIIADLQMSSCCFFKYRKELVDKGYLTIEKTRNANRAGANIYFVNDLKEEF